VIDPFRPDLLASKTTVVTGGGTGLGSSIALRLASLGASVAVVGRRPEPLEETARAIRERGGRAFAAVADVRDPAAVAAAFDAIEHALGPLNQLVNNAAGNFLAASEELSPGAFDAVVRIVLHGSFNCTTELGRRLIARGRGGEVLAITTTYAESGCAFAIPSACAKAGVLALVRSLAVEWAHYGIRVNALAPGAFRTEGAAARLMPGLDEEQLLRRVPAGRFGEHWELANLVAYLLSDASPYQTGDQVTVDGARQLFSGQPFAWYAGLDRAEAKRLLATLKPRK